MSPSETAAAPVAGRDPNYPYYRIPPAQNWKTAVTALPLDAIDPHTTTKFVLSKETKVASAGSCFAQRIAESLQDFGFNYHVVEPGPPWLTAQDKEDYGYGAYSARFGNIYTTLQLLQLMQRATGRFEPAEDYWRTGDRFADPFRPSIQPAGFVTADELRSDRRAHLNCVRQMFAEIDVFIFTLGLTETWVSAVDDAAFPTCPGRGVGEYSPDMYTFRNLSLAENIAYMEAFFSLLDELNPNVKVILSVSPVPLAATMENQHILQATTYSKAVLRLVAEHFRQSRPNVDYFAAYEIITATCNNERYFQEDRRNVTQPGVDHVMRCFFQHFTDTPPDQLRRVERAAPVSSFNPKVCDEEQMLRDINRDWEVPR